MGKHINLGVEVLFAPWDDTTGRYLELVSEAKHEIIVSIYGFHLPKLTDLLIAKHQAGVNVGMILDHTQAEGRAEAAEVAKLLAAGVPHIIGTSPEHRQILHSKLTVVDGHLVECGSWNYSLSASEQLNDLHIIDSTDVALEYLSRWEKIRDFILQAEWAMQAQGTIAPSTPAELPPDPISPVVQGAGSSVGGASALPPAAAPASAQQTARPRAGRPRKAALPRVRRAA